MTKPKHVRYLEDFSEKVRGLDLDPGEVVGYPAVGNKSILLRIVEDSDQLLSLSPFYVELSLGRGKPYCIESAFLVGEEGDHNLQPGVLLYKINEGSELYGYGRMIEGMNLPERSVVPLTKSRTLGRLVKRLESNGLGHSKRK